MNTKEFDKLMSLHGFRGEKIIEAMHLILVRKMSAADAARESGLSYAAITRANAKLKRPTCEHCGQPLPEWSPSNDHGTP